MNLRLYKINAVDKFFDKWQSSSDRYCITRTFAGNDVTGVIIKGRTLSHVMTDFRTISGNPRQFNYRDESSEVCISAQCK